MSDLYRINLQLFADPPGGESGGAPSGDPGPGGDPSGGGSGNPPPNTPTERMFTETQMQGAIRARLAEEQKKYADYDSNKNIVDRLAKITGRSAQDIQKELDGLVMETEANQAGMHPVVYQQLNQGAREIESMREENLNIRMDLEESKLMNDPMYSSLKDKTVNDTVREYARKTGATMEQSFWATQGATTMKQRELEMEQRIKTNLQNQMGHGNIMTEMTEEVKGLGLTADELAYCRQTGKDPADYAAMKNMNSIDAYRAHKKSKQK